MSSTPPLLPNEFVRRSAGGLEFRDEPIRFRIEMNGLQSRDPHELRVSFEFSVRVAESRTDQRMLAEMLLADREVLTRQDAIQYFVSHSRAGTEAFVAGRDAGTLIEGKAHDDLLDAIRRAVDAAAFSCGLIVLPPYRLEVESPTLQRERHEHLDRARAEARTTEQLQHLRRAGELAKQFETMQSGMSSFAPGKVLEQIAPADRGATLEAMLLASANRAVATHLWAVAGTQLVQIDPHDASSVPALIDLPAELGALRSVQPTVLDGEQLLLVGSQLGVVLVDPVRASSIRSLRLTGASSANGFNRAVCDESTRTIWATHNEFGLRAWDVDSGEPIEPEHHVSVPINGAKNLMLLRPGLIVWSEGSDLLFQSGRNGERRTVAAERGSPIIAIVAADAQRCFAVHQEGAIAEIDADTFAQRPLSQRSGQLCAAEALPWLGSIRLLLSHEAGAIECVGIDDQLVTQFASIHRGCRILAASADMVAAVSPDRLRLVLWHAWDGRRPYAEIHIRSHTRHRIADVEFA